MQSMMVTLTPMSVSSVQTERRKQSDVIGANRTTGWMTNGFLSKVWVCETMCIVYRGDQTLAAPILSGCGSDRPQPSCVG